MSTKFHKLLGEIHDKAWGKLWPRTICALHRRDIFQDKTKSGDGDEHMDIVDDDTEDQDDANNDTGDQDEDDFDDIPDETVLDCLLDADLLRRAFNIPGPRFDVIVICKEYEFLRELLEKEEGTFIMAGQPGTGKTVFLLYLLLHRLQLGQPTAAQFKPDEYIIFSADGAMACSTDSSTDHWDMLPTRCWCLTDGNPVVVHPCTPFDREDLRTVLITSPRPDRYKRWRTSVVAETVITALPRAVEVATIAQMNGWKAQDAIPIIRKWGPCTRTVLAILQKPTREKDFRRYAVQASTDIYNDPSKVLSYDLGSTVLFISPVRSKNNPDYGDSEFIIPTTYLSEIFDKQSQGISAEARMRLYEVFSMHLTTRTPAGWLHKKNMHLGVCIGDKCYELFNTSGESRMNSAALAPGGTASALRVAACNRPSSFYWIPSIVNFPGVDGVLVNDNNIYNIQATIADTHDGPLEGLRKVWKTIGAAVAEQFTWNFVIVTDSKALADRYATQLGAQLDSVTLGRRRVKVSVWVCVLKRGS